MHCTISSQKYQTRRQFVGFGCENDRDKRICSDRASDESETIDGLYLDSFKFHTERYVAVIPVQKLPCFM